MQIPQDYDQALLALGGTPALLVRNKAKIRTLFVERVNTILSTKQRDKEPMIIDTLPAFITDLALALSPLSSRSFASENSNIASEHGRQRARLTTFSLGQVLKEYQLFRGIVAEVISVDNPTDQEWAIIHRSIDHAIIESASSFMEVHQEMRERFTATLSHDIRGPLSVARANMQLILRNPAEADRHLLNAAKAIDNLDRINHMIEDLLDSSRVRAGEKIALELKECDLVRLVKKDVLDQIATSEGDRFVLKCDQGITGFWSEDRLRRAIYNLVQNAVKYGRENTQITVHLLEEHNRVQISVHNFGNPITVEDQKFLFEAYRRTQSARNSGKKGWGLGLVMVKAIAEAHGGTVVVESNPEEGTTFLLDILKDVRELLD